MKTIVLATDVLGSVTVGLVRASRRPVAIVGAGEQGA
jgi:hypothetical protein